MDLTTYRQSDLEQERVRELLKMVPRDTETALDVGARDGFISIRLSELVPKITALDLTTPNIRHPSITTVAGNATALPFPDNHFDLVLCSEVLEHIPPPGLDAACLEIVRVTRKYALIGVPFDQDTRVARTSCIACGAKNPPWGHVNSFPEKKLLRLFSAMKPLRTKFVGLNFDQTNFVSTILNDWAGNPWGTYEQDEPCVSCGARLVAPKARTLSSRVLSRLAYTINRVQRAIQPGRPNWIHILFIKSNGQEGN